MLPAPNQPKSGWPAQHRWMGGAMPRAARMCRCTCARTHAVCMPLRSPSCCADPRCLPPASLAPLPRVQLYSHHVLAQLARDAGEEGAAEGGKRARTLPSFWAEKAALERQRQGETRRAQRRAGAPAAAAQGGEGPGEEETAGEGGEGQARGVKRRRLAAGEEGQPAEEDGEGASEQEPLADYRCAAARRRHIGQHFRAAWGWVAVPRGSPRGFAHRHAQPSPGGGQRPASSWAGPQRACRAAAALADGALRPCPPCRRLWRARLATALWMLAGNYVARWPGSVPCCARLGQLSCRLV